MSKTICVPISLEAEQRLNYDQNLPGDLLEIEISQTEFNELWDSGFLQILNANLDILIDEYEDDVIVFEKLDQAIELISGLELSVVNQIKDLMCTARKTGVGIYFYF